MADKQIIIRKIKLFTFLMTKHRCLHLISYEMEALTAIVEGNEAIFFFSQKSYCSWFDSAWDVGCFRGTTQTGACAVRYPDWTRSEGIFSILEAGKHFSARFFATSHSLIRECNTACLTALLFSSLNIFWSLHLIYMPIIRVLPVVIKSYLGNVKSEWRREQSFQQLLLWAVLLCHSVRSV